MNQIEQAQHQLLDAIDEAVDDFSRSQATEDIGTEDYRPLTVDEALQHAGTIADNEEIFKAQEELVRAVIQLKYDEYVAHHQGEWSDEKAREGTGDYHRRVLR